MMMASYTLQLVGFIFFSIALFHIVSVLRSKSGGDGNSELSNKVHIKLAVIFFIVGLALFGFSVWRQ